MTSLNRSSVVCTLVLALCMYSVSGYASKRSPVVSLLELRHANIVQQKFDLSCGAAALATILKYQHMVDVTEMEIALEMLARSEYQQDIERIRDQHGFSLLDLKRFADNRGFIGEGYGQLTLDDLVEMAPAIVPVQFDGYDHFVIFRGMTTDRVLVGDPAWGNRVLERSAFESAWNDLGELGHVAFVVRDPLVDVPGHVLRATPEDFLLLR